MTGAPAIVEPLSSSARSGRATLEADGYVVIRNAVERPRVAAALRLLNLELARRGIEPAEVLRCQQSTFFPHLRWEKEIFDLVPPAAEEIVRQDPHDEWAEPQLLLRFPDEATEWPLEPHVDDLPPWACGRSYQGIMGVALTPAQPEDGCLRVWPGSHLGRRSEPVAVPLEPGDCVVMHPHLGHAAGLNRGPTIRVAVYFRLIAAVSAAPAEETPAPDFALREA